MVPQSKQDQTNVGLEDHHNIYIYTQRPNIGPPLGHPPNADLALDTIPGAEQWLIEVARKEEERSYWRGQKCDARSTFQGFQ